MSSGPYTYEVDALADDVCAWCGYPFDPGDDCMWCEELSGVFCSRGCAELAFERRAERAGGNGGASPASIPGIRPGRREGYSEIMFHVKPAEVVRAALKAAGWRWAPSNGCWYGPSSSLPEEARIELVGASGEAEGGPAELEV